MSLSEMYKWFEDQDTYDKGLLIFAFSQIIVFTILALKEYKIFDATPYTIAMIVPTFIIAKILLVVSVSFIVGLMVMIMIKPSYMKSEKEKE